MNSTNGQTIAAITGSEDSDGWIGYQIVLYADPNVSFAGQRVGGIRVRASRRPQVATPPRPTPPPPPPEPTEAVADDSLPF